MSSPLNCQLGAGVLGGVYFEMEIIEGDVNAVIATVMVTCAHMGSLASSIKRSF